MCRIFALRSSAPRSVYDSLFGGEHSLKNQSCGDSRKECHGDGWGIGHYNEDRAERVRSPRPAAQDPLYRQLAESLQARTLVAHVRQASMGNVKERNCHPFVFGRWMFAHNGTVVGFPAVREELRALLPLEFREHIQGDTDSEHAFFLILTRLEQMLGTLKAPATVEVLREALASTIRSLEERCPGEGEEPSRFNFVLTDGQSLVASRWGHTLFWEKIAFNGAEAVHVASEPTMAGQWTEVPERSFICVDASLDCRIWRPDSQR
jgi:predicted glutamine amidotransferase